MSIPSPAVSSKTFYERLGEYSRNPREIGGKTYTFAIEKLRKSCVHPCSVDDFVAVLERIPAHDLEGLDLIVLRQPKRKEEILAPVWGRMIYSYQFEGRFCPAIIFEAINGEKRLRWPKKLSVDDHREFERLLQDGHPFLDQGRYYEAEFSIKSARRTQLHRTLLHEIGHYVHYLKIVVNPEESEKKTDWERRWDRFWNISSQERENFAHQYAETMRRQLETSGVFRMLSPK